MKPVPSTRDDPTAQMPSMRQLAKALAQGVATAVVSPLLLGFWMNSRLVGRDRAVHGATQVLALVPGLTGQYLRRAFLCRALANCHATATIEFGTIFSKAGTILGENVYIGPMSHIGLVHFERDALLGAGVHVLSGAATHGISDPARSIRDQPGVMTMVRIGAGAWVGSAAVIMADVGRESVIGAGAVVTRPIPSRVVAAGVPARVLHSRDKHGEPGDGRSGSRPLVEEDLP